MYGKQLSLSDKNMNKINCNILYWIGYYIKRKKMANLKIFNFDITDLYLYLLSNEYVES